MPIKSSNNAFASVKCLKKMRCHSLADGMFFFFAFLAMFFLKARLFLLQNEWNSPSFSLVLRTKTAEQRIVLIPYRASGLPWPFLLVVACSQTLYFLFKVRRADRRVLVIKYKPRVNRGRFIDRQRKGVGVGEEENGLHFSFSRSALVLARSRARRCFWKERKEK